MGASLGFGFPLPTANGGTAFYKINFTTVTNIHIKPMTKEDMTAYFERVSHLDKAGAYGVQEGPRIYEPR